MKYGFVIDNRKCIGCHACTVACKSEHDVPIGVNRTWVKQVEKGTYPNTRRVFSVMRCNQCTDAPCVDICPTQALFIREDGIVDFDNERCIGCKSCMQACPYDALYIDPDTNTAAKCNYCAHRIDVGLEPACVNVCPEHAIISGDIENPDSEISQLLSREQVTVRKPEKGTSPNVYYINGDADSLNPGNTEVSDRYFWNSQSRGVGHFAKYAEKRKEGVDLKSMAMQLSNKEEVKERTPKSIDVLMQKNKRVYDSPDKGILWGWEVSAYVLTKAIAAGVFLFLLLGRLLGIAVSTELSYTMGSISIFFLGATGVLLIMDLDQPKRFLYVLLRPQWKSWLVRGGYFITFFGLFITLYLIGRYFDSGMLMEISLWAGAILALCTAVYTAFLFAQAKGRDFWQSPILAIHMLLHSVMAGGAVLFVLLLFLDPMAYWRELAEIMLITTISLNLIAMGFELFMPHPTRDAGVVAKSIISGSYRNRFRFGVVLVGNIIPLLILIAGFTGMYPLVGLLILVGLWFTEKIWVEAPQRIALS